MVAIHKPAHDIILKPVVSEKSYALSDRGQYTFVVAPNANKVQIKQAIEEIFNVKVTNVNVLVIYLYLSFDFFIQENIFNII